MALVPVPCKYKVRFPELIYYRQLTSMVGVFWGELNTQPAF